MFRDDKATLTIVATIGTQPGSYTFTVSVPGYKNEQGTLIINAAP